MKNLKMLFVGVVILAIGGGLFGYWKYTSLYPSTDDAYVEAYIVSVTPEVTGRVSAVHAAENQMVSKGDLLFEIDPADYENAITQAQSQVDAATRSIESYQQQIDAATAAINSATSADNAAQAQLDRVRALQTDGAISQASLDQSLAAAARSSSDVQAANAALSEAQTAAIANQYTLQSAQAALQLAQHNLTRTKILAPVDGWITNISLREGAVVTAYAPLFSMVDNSEWWVEANFKETDLTNIKVGQPVTLDVDMNPGSQLTGTVASIGRGSGATFSLLPAENASGNWVKVTQRFTVRIALDDDRPELRVGASASVTIDTTGAGQ